MKNSICQSHSPLATQVLGKKLATKLTQGGTLLLYGDLGSGKTTFVQGLAEGLGVTTKITSPTFTILNVYNTTHSQIQQLAHMDLYRISDSADIQSLDLSYLQTNTTTLLVVEWPERAEEIWKNVLGTITFTPAAFQHHEIEFSASLSSLLE